MKFKKILLLLVLLIVVCLGLGFWYLTTLENLNAYIPKIEQYVKEKLGHDLHLEEIRFTFLGGVTLEGRGIEWSLEDKMSVRGTCDKVYFHLKIFPLFIGKVEIAKVAVSNPAFRILKRNLDLTNVNSETESEGMQSVSAENNNLFVENKPPIPPVDLSKTEPSHLIPIPIIRYIKMNAFQIENGKIEYVDETSEVPTTFVLDAINLKANHISPVRPFGIAGSFQIDSIPVDIKGQIGPVGEKQPGEKIYFYPLDNIMIKLDLSADNLLMPLTQNLFPGFNQSDLGLKVSGSENFAIQVEGKIDNFKIHFFSSNTHQRIELADFLRKKTGSPLEVEASGDYSSSGDFSVDRATVTLDTFRLRGKGRFDTRAVTAKSFNVRSDIYLLDDLSNLIPSLIDLNISGQSQLDLSFKNFNFQDQSGLLKGEFNMNNISIRPDWFEIPLICNRLNVEIRRDEVILNPLVFRWGDGRITAEGEVEDYWSSPSLDLEGKIQKVNLDSVLAETGPKDISLGGVASGSFDLKAGRAAGRSFLEVLDGNFRFKIQKGAIRNFNMIEEVSVQSSGIPGLGNSLEVALAKRFPRIANSKDTEFETAQMEGDIVGGTVRISQFLIRSPEFDIVGRGQYDLKNRYINFNGKLIFSLEATDALMHIVKELAYLRDSSGYLTFSFTIAGKDKDVRVSIVKGLIQSALQQVLLNNGVKLLFGNKNPKSKYTTPQTQAQPPESAQPSQPKEVEPLDELIQYGLNKLFKRKKV